MSFAHSSENEPAILPPDSTSSIIDKTASLYYIEEGKKAFTQGKTRDALRRFREAYVRDQYSSKAAYWIAEAHYTMDNYGLALKYAEIASTLSEEDNPDLIFLMGQAYHREGKLDKAKENYEKSKTLLSNAKKKAYEIDAVIADVDFADSVSLLDNIFEKSLLDYQVNSGYDDYNLVLFDGGKKAFFVSRRPDTKGGNINPDDQRFFEDAYWMEWDEKNNEWGVPTNEIPRLNSEGFDAVNHIMPDGNELYMTVNTSVVDVKNPTRSSDICVAKKTKEDRWNTPRAIKNKTINTSYFDGAPTLTADGNTMYFVSDREGEKSKSDIYVVYKDGNSWGEASKLPMEVNSLGNETTPFITGDGRYLFFSSDGHKGMGGYDVYVTENKGNKWTTPVNLGPDFNSVNDDIFFKYYKDFKKATVSTYRIQGNKSSMDIYQLEIEKWEIPTSEK